MARERDREVNEGRKEEERVREMVGEGEEEEE